MMHAGVFVFVIRVSNWAPLTNNSTVLLVWIWNYSSKSSPLNKGNHRIEYFPSLPFPSPLLSSPLLSSPLPSCPFLHHPPPSLPGTQPIQLKSRNSCGGRWRSWERTLRLGMLKEWPGTRLRWPTGRPTRKLGWVWSYSVKGTFQM